MLLLFLCWDVNEAHESIKEPKKLEWRLTNELKMAVRFAETRLSDLICQNEVFALEFELYGKNAITRLSLLLYVSR